MKTSVERVLVAFIYAVSGGLFGAGVFWAGGGNPNYGCIVGCVSGVAWSWGKEFRHVWRAGLGFAALGLIAGVLLLLAALGTGRSPGGAWWGDFLGSVLSGWICGSLFGTEILSRRKIVESWYAVVAGGAVGFLALCLDNSLWLMFRNEPNDSWGWAVVVIGLGPPAAILGGIVGYHLYRLGEEQEAQ